MRDCSAMRQGLAMNTLPLFASLCSIFVYDTTRVLLRSAASCYTSLMSFCDGVTRWLSRPYLTQLSILS